MLLPSENKHFHAAQGQLFRREVEASACDGAKWSAAQLLNEFLLSRARSFGTQV